MLKKIALMKQKYRYWYEADLLYQRVYATAKIRVKIQKQWGPESSKYTANTPNFFSLGLLFGSVEYSLFDKKGSSGIRTRDLSHPKRESYP